MPSKKWLASRVTAFTGLAIMWATTGAWDKEETIAGITLVSAALISYLIPNTDDGGGGSPPAAAPAG